MGGCGRKPSGKDQIKAQGPVGVGSHLRGQKSGKSGVCPRRASPVLARQKIKGLTSL
jgi:hypothetical protein